MKWIDFSKRKPDKVGEYLVFSTAKGIQVACWVCLREWQDASRKTKYGWARPHQGNPITHWRPLLKSPNESAASTVPYQASVCFPADLLSRPTPKFCYGSNTFKGSNTFNRLQAKGENKCRTKMQVELTEKQVRCKVGTIWHRSDGKEWILRDLQVLEDRVIEVWDEVVPCQIKTVQKF